jgi:cell wall-associated NlpC family hydrolase
MKRITILGVVLSMSASMFAGQASAATAYETEVTAGVNFRAKPSTDSSVYRLIPKGEDIHVLEEVNRYWLKIEVKEGKVGYISANDKYTDYTPYDSSLTTAKGGVNFRSQAKVDNNKIGYINKGDTVQVLEEVNSYWLKINYEGKVGYASSNYFDNLSTSSKDTGAVSTSANQMISTAKSYIGDFKYKFGAEPWNTNYRYSDCSAFIQLVFNKKHGYTLPRTSRSQSKEGSYVSKSNLKPGDLVFFDTNNDGVINHVGIYIGNGDFVHSSPVNEVGINDLNSGYWKDHYETARRVL